MPLQLLVERVGTTLWNRNHKVTKPLYNPPKDPNTKAKQQIIRRKKICAGIKPRNLKRAYFEDSTPPYSLSSSSQLAFRLVNWTYTNLVFQKNSLLPSHLFFLKQKNRKKYLKYLSKFTCQIVYFYHTKTCTSKLKFLIPTHP